MYRNSDSNSPTYAIVSIISSTVFALANTATNTVNRPAKITMKPIFRAMLLTRKRTVMDTAGTAVISRLRKTSVRMRIFLSR